MSGLPGIPLAALGLQLAVGAPAVIDQARGWRTEPWG
jgi:hypothetical protein